MSLLHIFLLGYSNFHLLLQVPSLQFIYFLVLGIADHSKHDGVPYTTLTYATGSKVNFQYDRKDNWVAREDPSNKDTTDINYANLAAILTDKETHGGGDVTVYATGLFSILIS